MTAVAEAPPVPTRAERLEQVVKKAFTRSSVAGPLAAWLIIFALCSAFVDNFFTWRTASGIVNAATVVGFVTVGVTVLMIAGEFDLSVGPLVAMGGFLFGQQVDNPAWAIVLAVGLPALFGLLNGVAVAVTKIPSFIVTLGTRSIFTGFVWVVVSGGTVLELTDHHRIYDALNGRINFINDHLERANFRFGFVWLLLTVIVLQYVLFHTKFGNHVQAVGGDKLAATSQGARPALVKTACFAIVGACCGFAGMLTFAQFQFAQVSTGAGMELTAIAAAVVGGTLLTGGMGSIWGGLVGVLMIQTLRSGVVLMNLSWIPADNFDAVVGATIVLAVILNYWLRRRAA